MSSAYAFRCSQTFPHDGEHLFTAAGRLAFYDVGRGHPVICIHGLGGDYTHFEHMTPMLADGYRVIGLDLPGCGGSCKPDSRLSLATHARAVVELMRALGLTQATLVGHSAGGQVCAEVARLSPDRVSHLVLVNSAGMRSYPALMRWGAAWGSHPQILRRILGSTGSKILSRVFANENEHTAHFRRGALNRPREPLLTDLCKVFHDMMPDLMRPTVAGHAADFNMPALIIWGDRDRLVPLRAVRKVASRFPRGRLEVIEGCGHMPIIEQPRRTAELIKSFLA